jgi:hypothetical protein
LSFDDILDQNEASEIIYTPDNFIASLIEMENQARAGDELEGFKDYIDDLVPQIEKIMAELSAKKDLLNDRRIDYEELKAVLMTKEYKERLETILKLADEYQANGQKVLDFVNTKRNELLV